MASEEVAQHDGQTTHQTVPHQPKSPVRPIEEAVQTDEDIMKINTRIILIVYVIVVALGVGTGYLLSQRKDSIASGSTKDSASTESKQVVGSKDTKTFKDSAVGTVEAGGMNGEGSHKLIREGGPSQTAYLVSSVVDLDQFVGKKVKVWGQTMAAQNVSWLMDVGKVELLKE